MDSSAIMKASSSSVLLDLANIPEWLSRTQQMVKRLIPARVREDLQKFDPEEMYEDTMTYLVNCSTKHGDFVEVGEWSDKFDSGYLRRYTHIRAFHACRAYTGLESYKTHGIQKLSRPLLKELAHLVFGDNATAAAIDKAVNNTKISSVEKSVYLFTDSIHPLDEACNHYLLSGSEILQAMSIDLGLHSRRILASQGEPYLIECEIPLKHVSQGFRQELWRKFVTQSFRIAAGANCPTKPYDFCIRVTKPVSPESITAFHRIDGRLRSFCSVH